MERSKRGRSIRQLPTILPTSNGHIAQIVQTITTSGGTVQRFSQCIVILVRRLYIVILGRQVSCVLPFFYYNTKQSLHKICKSQDNQYKIHEINNCYFINTRLKVRTFFLMLLFICIYLFIS